MRFECVVEKIKVLQHQHFLYWSASFQRVILLIGAVLFYIGLVQLFDEKSQQVATYKSQITALAQKIQTQKDTIKKYSIQNEMDVAGELSNKLESLNLANFLHELSMLAKQHHLEISSIKPLPQKEEKTEAFEIQTVQINLTGEYEDLLKLMQHVSTLSDVLMTDFKITLSPKNQLNVVMLVDLYGNT